MSSETLLVDARRLGDVRQDARGVRRTIAALSSERTRDLPPIGLHMYPRSITYRVSGRGGGTNLIMYGSTVDGRTVRAFVRGYRSYMFVRLPDSVANDTEQIKRFVQQLDRALLIVALQPANGGIGASVGRVETIAVDFLLARTQARKTLNATAKRPVLEYRIVDAVSMKASGADRGFNGDRAERFIQLFMYAPQYVRAARDLLEFVYDERERTISNGDELARLFIEGVVDARSRSDLSTPDTDVKGRVREAGPRLKPTEQRLVDVAAATPKLSSFASAASASLSEPSAKRRRVAKAVHEAGDPDGEHDGDEKNPWNDDQVDVRFDDADEVPDYMDPSEVHASEADGERPRINLSLERVVANMRTVLRHVDEPNNVNAQRTLRLVDDAPVEVYEADIDFVVRFAIDAHFKPEECVVFQDVAKIGHDGLNAIEFECDWTSVLRCPIEAYQNTIQPQVCCSFDCEMETGIDGAFPQAATESVLQACCVFFDPVSDPRAERVVRRAFVMGSIDLAAPEAAGFAADEIYSFARESDFLETLSEFLRYVQPDMLTGWNIENFDMTYLVERAEHLQCGDRMSSMCRDESARLRIAERSFSSSAHGTHLYKEVTGEGLWVWDLYQAFKRSTSYKLRSYSLEYVSNTFLDERKEDVAYSAINGLQQSAAGRAKLMRYCMKDSLLPARLAGRLNLLVGNIELSRLNGVPMDMICRRGLQIRLKASLYNEGRWAPCRRLFYTRTSRDRLESMGSTYAGAHVEDPDIGYHDEVVVTLDFKSLYPSIIVLLWMCVSTLLPGRSIQERMRRFGFTEDDFWPAECDALDGEREDQPAFMKSTSVADIGMVPRILQRLLAERKRVKKLMAAAEKVGDEFLRSLYDSRQLAIKLNCNAIYGVFGAASSFAYCPEIAAMVTALGRMFIRLTKTMVEETFTRANGYPYDAKVVYGDTVTCCRGAAATLCSLGAQDSVFVKLHVPEGAGERITIEQSAVFGEEMAAYVTAYFKQKYGNRPDNIMELEFEKSFSKIIFYAKKRYVGWKWELKYDAEAGRKIMKRKAKPEASGMETERRDSTLLVSESVRDVLRMLLSDEGTRAENKERVREFILNEMVRPLETGTVSWDRLVQSKQFRMRVAEYTRRGQKPPVHILLAKRLDERLGVGADGTYKPGDRVEYVVVEQEHPGQKTSELGEDPKWAWQHRMRLSREHYIESQVHGTMARVLEPVLLEDVDVEDGETRSKRQRTIGAFAAKRDESTEDPDDAEYDEPKEKRRKRAMRAYHHFIAAGRARRQHVVIETRSASTKRGIGSFASGRERRCRVCSAPGTDVCAHHSADEVCALDEGRAAKRQCLDTDRDQLWRVCTACSQQWRAEDDETRAAALPPPVAGRDIEDAVPCGTSSCKYWYRRKMVDRSLEAMDTS